MLALYLEGIEDWIWREQKKKNSNVQRELIIKLVCGKEMGNQSIIETGRVILVSECTV